MDYQTAFNVVVGGFGFLAGILITNIWKEIKQVQRNERETVNRIASIEVLVAGNYVSKEEFTHVMDKLFKKMDEINEKLNTKADK